MANKQNLLFSGMLNTLNNNVSAFQVKQMEFLIPCIVFANFRIPCLNLFFVMTINFWNCIASLRLDIKQ